MKYLSLERRRYYSGKLIPGLSVFLLAGAAALGDALVLDDGSRVEGKIHKDGDHWVVVDSSGKQTEIGEDHIQSFVVGGTHAAQTPEQQLESLRKEAGKLTDLNQIISRYKEFISSHSGAEVVADTKSDLAGWQAKLAANEVKVGSRWMTPADRANLAASLADDVGQIVKLIQQNDLADAVDLVKQALAEAPDDPTVNYLNGVVLAAGNHLQPARLAFEHVTKLTPDLGASHNNLAVILCRQQQFPAAMNQYVLAMTDSPVNQAILDNVAEALHAVPAENKDSPPVLKATALFTEQDGKLADAQLLKGLVRWGATWVKKEQLPDLQKEEAADEQAAEALQNEIDRLNADLGYDKRAIRIDHTELDRLRQSTAPVPVSAPVPTKAQLPPTVTPVGLGGVEGIQQDFAFAKQDGRSNYDQLLARRAEQAPTTLTIPMYTGVQKIMGPEGLPAYADPPSTQPAPPPAAP